MGDGGIVDTKEERRRALKDRILTAREGAEGGAIELKLDSQDLEFLAEGLEAIPSYQAALRRIRHDGERLQTVAKARFEFERSGGSTKDRARRAVRILGWSKARARRERRFLQILGDYVRLTVRDDRRRSVLGDEATRLFIIDEPALKAGDLLAKCSRSVKGTPVSREEAVIYLWKWYKFESNGACIKALNRARQDARQELKATSDESRARYLKRLLENCPEIPQNT